MKHSPIKFICACIMSIQSKRSRRGFSSLENVKCNESPIVLCHFTLITSWGGVSFFYFLLLTILTRSDQTSSISVCKLKEKVQKTRHDFKLFQSSDLFVWPACFLGPRKMLSIFVWKTEGMPLNSTLPGSTETSFNETWRKSVCHRISDSMFFLTDPLGYLLRKSFPSDL